jgi:hypothetical protein
MLNPQKNLVINKAESRQSAFLLFARGAFLGFILVLVLVGISLAEDLRVPAAVNSPRALSAWLAGNFRYELKLTDAWQTPQETIALRKGDCDDFALLAQAVLKRAGIKSDVVILKFKGLSVMHALCIWKDSDGLYSFFSNFEMYRTGKADIRQAISKFYPDVEDVIFTDQNMRFTKIARLN